VRRIAKHGAKAIELAKCFAEEDAYRFVNGILDPVSKELRPEA
jgi:transcription termination factor NusB